MKIQCHVCEVAEAAVLCCADEAALCHACDEKVHAANKLASKHQRVSISNSSSQMPKCDICQEMIGYFFCLEDRALLCWKCDVAIHTANPFVSAHQRFLLTGVKVGLEPMEPRSSSSGRKPLSRGNVSETETHSVCRRNAALSVAGQYETVLPTQNQSAMMSLAGDYAKIVPVQSGDDFMPSRLPLSGGSAAGSIPQWHINDFLELSEFHQNYGYTDHGSSKADSGKLGESDSSTLKSSEDDLDMDDRLGQVPDVAWAVPQAASPPTASGLFWPNSSHHIADTTAFVPDICWAPLQNPRQHRPKAAVNKRLRQKFC